MEYNRILKNLYLVVFLIILEFMSFYVYIVCNIYEKWVYRYKNEEKILIKLKI